MARLLADPQLVEGWRPSKAITKVAINEFEKILRKPPAAPPQPFSILESAHESDELRAVREDDARMYLNDMRDAVVVKSSLATRRR